MDLSKTLSMSSNCSLHLGQQLKWLLTNSTQDVLDCFPQKRHSGPILRSTVSPNACFNVKKIINYSRVKAPAPNCGDVHLGSQPSNVLVGRSSISFGGRVSAIEHRLLACRHRQLTCVLVSGAGKCSRLSEMEQRHRMSTRPANESGRCDCYWHRRGQNRW